jgi:hypothetical protein
VIKASEALKSESFFLLLERKRIFDAAWVLSLVFLVLALAVPWGLGIVDLNFVKLTRDVFIFTLAFAFLAWATDRLPRATPMVVAIYTMQTLGIGFMAYLWALVGGIHNPGFLLFFVLTMIASSLIMLSWQPYLSAVLSVTSVWVVALHQSHELQWYVTQLGWPSSWVQALRSLPLPDSSAPFAGSSTSPASQFTLLIIFSAVQIALAVVSTSMAGLLLRLYARVRSYTDLSEEARGLFQAVLRAATEPTVVAYADNFQILYASDSFFERMLVRPDEVAGKSLFDVVKCEGREKVEAKLAEGKGDIPFLRLHVGQEMLIANVRFYRTEHRGSGYLNVIFHEITDLYYFGSAFDSIGDPLLLVGDDERLLYANMAGRELFGELYFGKDMKTLLRQYRLVTTTLADTAADTRKVTIEGQPYLLSVSTAQLGDNGKRCWVFWLSSLPVKNAA